MIKTVWRVREIASCPSLFCNGANKKNLKIHPPDHKSDNEYQFSYFINFEIKKLRFWDEIKEEVKEK